MNTVAIADPNPDDLGPAMQGLDERQRRFVIGWIGSRGKNASKVARAAGYANASAGVSAHHLLQNPKIIKALGEEADRRLDGLAVLAVAALGLNLGSSNPKVRQVAADSVLDRTGRGRRSIQDIHVDQTDSRTTAELMDEVRRLMGGDAVPVVIDG
jgi:phage terminase small subunit